MADPRVTDIPVEDCGEPLVDVSTGAFLKIDPRKADGAGNWLLLRAGLVTRLAHAASLLPEGLYLLHIEGYRPPELQAHYFTAYLEQLADNGCYTEAPNISRAARANRDILTGAMSAAGLVNYPTEWWHWSFGDRYWALTTGHPSAIHGAHRRSGQDG